MNLIKTENFIINNISFVRTYSDQGLRICSEDGTVYDIAEDPAECGRTYTETDEYIDGEDITAEEALAIITGEEAEDHEEE